MIRAASRVGCVVEPGNGGVRAAGPWADVDRIAFAVPDPEHRLAGVRLLPELDLPATLRDFDFDTGVWRLELPPPPAARMEYRVELQHPDGGIETTTDPGNPRSTPGTFGPKSVLELPGYAAPAWLDRASPWPVSAELSVETEVGPVEVTVRSPAAATRRLLLAHDGPEYDALAALGGFAAALEQDGRLPPFQLALAAPGARNDRYSADPDYSDALADRVLPRLHETLGTAGPAVLMGASLGALAALHLQRRHPDLVAGLFLQSGSFFTPELDACESQFPHFARIVAAVDAVHRHRPAGRAVPTVLTCGAAEENRHNNRRMAETLRRQGYPVTLAEVPDAHNYVAWRDAFDPHLAGLLQQVWGHLEGRSA
jgi:enterochelin esterase family protein